MATTTTTVRTAVVGASLVLTGAAMAAILGLHQPRANTVEGCATAAYAMEQHHQQGIAPECTGLTQAQLDQAMAFALQLYLKDQAR